MSVAMRDGSKSNKSEVEVEVEVSSFTRSGTDFHHHNNIAYYNTSKLEDSDEDLLTVPDVEASPAKDSTNNNTDQIQNQKRRRKGRNPVDKEYRRIKRLLRNRVSAQQARERKKVYVNELESRAKELQDLNSKLEETISTLTNENTMLRKVLLNTRPKLDHTTTTTIDQKHHVCSAT
ncbi:hypothetical protein LWI28_026930 [Acer negundo]|uniref:BZIP domain-containing protein n=1 Tax=Acer negundo TaxID=4023 RepID=A0AAD5JNC1_ACENE|nr:hypothetical protein LWI28_026930 [Acer negundo]KAK4856156.1 hypothetical protein QYF36_014673 [Acer negundo]